MVWHDCLLTTNDEHLFTGLSEMNISNVSREAYEDEFSELKFKIDEQLIEK